MWISYRFVLLCSSELLEVRRKNWLLEFKAELQRHRVTYCFSHVGTLCPWNIGDIICFTLVLRDRSGDPVCVEGVWTHCKVQAKESGERDLHTGQGAVRIGKRGATSKDCHSHQAPRGASFLIQPPHSQFTEMPGVDHRG